jgi:LysR family cys regulon transcriptional activator
VNLQQMRYVVEIVRHDYHLSGAAEALNTSQPGVSRQVKLLESELGLDIFVRTRNRILGLTDSGEYVHEVARQVMSSIDALQSLKYELQNSGVGTMTLATTHTQARYVLPPVITRFVKAYPNVQLVLRQGDPGKICDLVANGDADLAIGVDAARVEPGLVRLPCYSRPRSVVAPKGHPILSVEPLTLEAIAAYPIITYDPQNNSSASRYMEAFTRAGLKTNIALAGIDADVCKVYIGLGLGIGILTAVTIDPARDTELVVRDAHHLFEYSTTYVTLRANAYLRNYVVDFIHMFAPSFTPTAIRRAVQQGGIRPDGSVMLPARPTGTPASEA